MSIQKLVLTNKYTSQPTEPTPTGGFTAQTLKEEFQKQPDQIEAFVNSLIDQLESIVAGKSGAELIGSATINGVAGLTVHAQMASLKQQITASVIGNIPDGTLTGAKFQTGTITDDILSNNAGQIKDKVSTLENKIKFIDTVLSTGSWVVSADYADYPLQYDIVDSSFDASAEVIKLFIDETAYDIVSEAGLRKLPKHISASTTLRVYAEATPTQNINLRIEVIY